MPAVACMRMRFVRAFSASASRPSSDYMMHGLAKLPRLPQAETLLAQAQKGASKLRITEPRTSRSPVCKLSTLQMEHFSKSLSKPLGKVVDGYNWVWRHLHPFERVAADLTVRSRSRNGLGSFEEEIAAVKKLRKDTVAIAKEAAHACAQTKNKKEAVAAAEQGYARVHELWQRDAWVLRQLDHTCFALRTIPAINPELPAIVLVGSPNVGKSSIVRAVSTGKPEVNNYPFTTRGMSLGQIRDPGTNEWLCQVMDTPGLLPRADEKRNDMEQLTLASLQPPLFGEAAVHEEANDKDYYRLGRGWNYLRVGPRYLPSAVCFVLDLSGMSGSKSSIEAQLNIRNELLARFPDSPWIDVITKKDLPEATIPKDLSHLMPDSPLRISVVTEEGIPQLMSELHALVYQLREKHVGVFPEPAF